MKNNHTFAYILIPSQAEIQTFRRHADYRLNISPIVFQLLDKCRHDKADSYLGPVFISDIDTVPTSVIPSTDQGCLSRFSPNIKILCFLQLNMASFWAIFLASFWAIFLPRQNQLERKAAQKVVTKIKICKSLTNIKKTGKDLWPV